MLCYRDRSYCSWSNKCGNDSCHRKFTEEDREHATKWWGDENFPVCYGDFYTETCGAIINVKR